ncbi:hypothetical protein [Methylocella sp.]|jgi:hypothetical protein|uniref:hypothetical protein n=1 Tax=Methylocella sp. TaxID=1978226 RepID=UPI003C25B035
MRRAITAILVAGTVGLLAGCGRHEEQKETPLPLPQGTPKRPTGLPGLTVNPGAPEPFTKSDVAAYFATHNLPLNAGAKGDFTVANLEFLTAKQASDRLAGEPTGLNDNDRVGFATLTGKFIFSGPSNTKPATFSSAYALFDAATGNLLMDGTLESGKGDNPR